MARSQVLGLVALLALTAGDAVAEISGDLVKIGVLNDQSGVYADGNGPGSVVAARMAVEDFGEVAPGVRIEVVAADHQNKPDVGAEIARRWIDTEGVDAIVDLPTSSVALAVSRARPASAEQYPRLHNVVEGLCIAAGLPKPRLYVIDDPAPNAFANSCASAILSASLMPRPTDTIRSAAERSTSAFASRNHSCGFVLKSDSASSTANDSTGAAFPRSSASARNAPD